MTEENSGEILVVCRFRPLNEKEQNISNSICVDFGIDMKSVSVPQEGQSPLTFRFDQVFQPSAFQEEVYQKSAKSIVESVMQGYNGTVLAYGQTSSGKTFTMTGVMENPTLMGITPRMVTHLFEFISNSSDQLEFTVKISYCEIYMEKIRDLIDISRKDLKVHEDKIKGVYIGNLSESYVSSDNGVYELMKIGTNNREVGFTEMNKGSSRSHAIFIVSVTQTNTQNLSTKVGKLYLVDLAGSEKVGKTGAAGKRLEEAKTINKSLTVLGQVIMNLTDSKSTHIPYRDSKLTRVLQDSLGGNSKTSLIITCSPSPYNLDETISTLRFGIRAKSIKNKPKVNKEYTVAELKVLLAKAQEEIDKKSKIIENLQIEIKSTGGKITTGYSEPGEVLVSLEEVYEDIEQLKEKYEQETLTTCELRNELLLSETRYQEIILDNSSMMEELKSCHEELLMVKSLKDSLSENLSELQNSKEVYEKQISQLNLEILQLQQKNKEISDDLRQTQKECSQHVTLTQYNDDLQKLSKKLSEEQSKNTSITKQLQILKERNQELSKKNCDLEVLKENLVKEVQVQEASKFYQEKQLLTNDLQNRIQKVIELELALDDSREALRIFEGRISQGDRAIIKRNEMLERNIEHITDLYYKLLNERTTFMHDNEVLVNKVVRLCERISSLEEQIRIKELTRFDDRSVLGGLNESRVSRGSQLSGSNIRRPIKGGKKHS
jgi:kinesin family protein 5